jgi:hypothetical protein
MEDYRINGDILSELKKRPAVEKIQNYINKRMKHVGRTNRDRQRDCRT